MFEERNKRIIEMRRDGMTLAAIGREFGISRERVRQIVIRLNGPTADEAKAARTKPCRAPGCDEQTLHHTGLCCFHQHREKRGKPLSDPKHFNRWRSSGWCTHPGCRLPAFSRNLCKAHGRLKRIGADMNTPIRDQSARRKSMFCQVTECDGGHYARGYCRRCYYRNIINPRNRKAQKEEVRT